MSSLIDKRYVAALQVVKCCETLDVGISVGGLEEHPEAFPAIRSAVFLDMVGVDNVAWWGWGLAEDKRTWQRWDRDRDDHERV